MWGRGSVVGCRGASSARAGWEGRAHLARGERVRGRHGLVWEGPVIPIREVGAVGASRASSQQWQEWQEWQEWQGWQGWQAWQGWQGWQESHGKSCNAPVGGVEGGHVALHGGSAQQALVHAVVGRRALYRGEQQVRAHQLVGGRRDARGGHGLEQQGVLRRGDHHHHWRVAGADEGERVVEVGVEADVALLEPMLKTRRRSVRPDPPPGGTRSGRCRPRAAPNFGHPRPISRLEPRLVLWRNGPCFRHGLERKVEHHLDLACDDTEVRRHRAELRGAAGAVRRVVVEQHDASPVVTIAQRHERAHLDERRDERRDGRRE